MEVVFGNGTRAVTMRSDSVSVTLVIKDASHLVEGKTGDTIEDLPDKDSDIHLKFVSLEAINLWMRLLSVASKQL